MEAQQMSEGNIDVLSTRLSVLHEDVTEIKGAMKTLSDAITKLALVEDRQATTVEAVERAFKAIERIEQRLNKLEMQSPINHRIAAWVDKAVVGIIVIVALFVAKKIGLA